MDIMRIKYAKGEVYIPGDKSISHRGIMLGALGAGKTEIKGFLNGADCLSTIDCFSKMGIEIKKEGTTVIIEGKGLYGLKEPKSVLYTGNSGTTTRLLAGLLSGQNFNSVIDGDASIRKRPMKRVTNPLAMMGASIEGEYCPLKINKSQLKGISYTMPEASAQVKTALILAGLYADGQTVIHENLRSRNHTELMLKAMDADIDVKGNDIILNPGKRLLPQSFVVPGDISSAAYFMVLACILPNSEILIKNVGINETRDGIIEVLENMGANISILNKRCQAGEMVADILVKSSELKGIEIGGEIIPRLIDEIPAIAVLAAFAKGKTVIKNAEELKVKETNRIRAVVNELLKAGVDIKETDDGMIINGGKEIHGADFKSYKDHRMAMSLSILAQGAVGNSTIDDADCVNISYPDFYKDLEKLSKWHLKYLILSFWDNF